MVYMAGDNNLSIDMAYALRDIREAAKVQNKKVNLMVYYDGSGLDTPTLYCDFSDFDNPHYEPAYTVEKRFTYKDPDVAEMAKSKNENAATMYSILNFVDWCINPKKRGKQTDQYALIFSGHGFGFQSVSFLSDESSDYYMTIKKLRVTLRKVHEEIIKKPIALIGFDCCVMGMLEIAHEIKSHAGAMIASEGSIPNAGWTYGNILGDLVSDKDHSDPNDVAKRFVREFIDSQREFSVGGVSVDMSAWDLQKTGSVVDALDDLGEILLYGLLKDSDLYRPLRNALIQSHWESQSYMFEQNVDLKDFCERLLDATSEIKSDEKFSITVDGNTTDYAFLEVFRQRCNAVCLAVDDAVLASGFVGGVYQFSNGIAVFFPWSFQTYLFSERSYTGLQFAQNEGSNWNAFLVHYLRDVTLRGQNAVNGWVNPLFGHPDGELENVGALNLDEAEPTASGSTRIIVNPANRVIDSITKRIIANPASRIITNPANRAVANSTKKLYNYPAYRIIQNAASRIIANPASRIIANPANRIIANPASRMLGGSDGTLSGFKNVATPWDIFGYSKKEERTDGDGEKADAAGGGPS